MPDRELQTIARATCRFVINDTDAVIRKQLKEYYDKCRKIDAPSAPIFYRIQFVTLEGYQGIPVLS